MGGLAYYQTVFVREDLARGITTSRMDGRLDVDGVISEEVDDFDE